MLPLLEVPIGRGAGVVLLLLALAWWVFWSRRPDAERGRRALAALALAPGLFLLVGGFEATLRWPVYGLMMALGTVAALALAMRMAAQRGVSPELVVELAIVGLVCGLLGARAVYLVEQWDAMFADRPPLLAGRGPEPGAPLAPGDALLLRTHAGEAAVRFAGDERDLAAVVAAIGAQAGGVDVVAAVVRVGRRGTDGLVVTERGLTLSTGRRGADALLEVSGGPAAPKLGLARAATRGVDRPWVRVLDLRLGGLTYFGSVFGVLLGWAFWLRRRRARPLAVFDAVCPVLPLGLFFGRLGCLARGCCFGREVDGFALFTVEYPPWSLPWMQMAGERLTCDFDGLLRRRELTAEMLERLGPLAQGTPPVHAAQLYEGLGVLVVFALVLVYRARWATREGQCFALLFLLQAPLRFVVEHVRRDHDVFFPLGGYPFTESQLVAIGLSVAALPAFVWLSRHGRPLGAAPVEAPVEAALAGASAPASAPAAGADAAPRA